ncbi:MAG: Methionyl-tRNA formyltransferase [Candidatus Levybacteria bacterium]|nr:Methionyl-tRNA formyltransferase [Candidatus Levybacteria bacterium]
MKPDHSTPPSLNDPMSQSPNDLITQLPNRLPIVFFGSSNYVIPIIEVLQKNFDLKLVLTTEKPEGAVSSFCKQNKIEFLSVSNLSSPTISHKLLAIGPIVGVLTDFGLIIPEEILNLFPKGIINVHPSFLPAYRGPTPVQSAILNGDKITGVSIMKLDDKIDHGPILGQEKEEILDTDTAESLYKRLFAKGAILLSKILISYLKDNLKPIAQNHEKATFTKTLKREDGFVDISKIKDQKSKIELEKMVRAYFPWPGVWTRLRLSFGGQSKIIKLLPNNLITQKPNNLIAQQPNNPILIQVEGKKPVSYKDFLNGYPEAKEDLKFIFYQ